MKKTQFLFDRILVENDTKFNEFPAFLICMSTNILESLNSNSDYYVLLYIFLEAGVSFWLVFLCKISISLCFCTWLNPLKR